MTQHEKYPQLCWCLWLRNSSYQTFLKKRGFLFVVLRSQLSARCSHQSVLITTELFLCGKNKTLICKLETGNRSSNSEIRRRNAPLWNADWKTIRISLNNSDHKLTTFKNVYIEPEVGNTSANFVTTFDFSPLTSEQKYIWTFFFFFSLTGSLL